MLGPVTLDFLETVVAQCPKDSTTIIACGRKLYQLVEIYYGALKVRDADGFEIKDQEPFEIMDTQVTSYWYLPKENHAKER